MQQVADTEGHRDALITQEALARENENTALENSPKDDSKPDKGVCPV